MNRYLAYSLIVLLLAGCATPYPRYFAQPVQAPSERYGYEPTEPMALRNGSRSTSLGGAHYFLSRLQTDRGQRLRIVAIRPKIISGRQSRVMSQAFAFQPMPHGQVYVEEFVLIDPEAPRDSIHLYVDPQARGPVYLPKGLQYQP